MKILLDTNIVIHREANNIIKDDIGILFSWLDKLRYTKCIHPVTVEEVRRCPNEKLLKTMIIKLDSYYILKTTAPVSQIFLDVTSKIDSTNNDQNDSILLNEAYADRVDFLITEDRKIHKKASALGIADKVFTIDSFLEKVTAENPNLVNYEVLAVKKEYLGNIKLEDPFFDSFRDDYLGFDKWFNKKAEEIAYVCYEKSQIMAFLYLKIEDENENYSDISPPLQKKRRLKIGTFKVTLNGFKIGERFLKIIFDNAHTFSVDEIYVTIFDKTIEQQRLIELLIDWGFKKHGVKSTPTGEENVYVRSMVPSVNLNFPKTTYPYFSSNSNAFLVPIYPAYHTDLFPDSKLRTESAQDFIENEPYRNAISKVYISRSIEKNLRPGDLIIFYRTGDREPKKYTSVISTIGIVERVDTGVSSAEDFVSKCRKRSVFTDSKLIEHWDYNKSNRPFIVNFLYTYSFPKRINLEELIQLGIISNVYSVPRGFSKINKEQLLKIIKATNTDESLIVD